LTDTTLISNVVQDGVKPRYEGVPAEGLAAIGIGKTYRNRDVVQGVNLHVQRGEIVALMGPNGAGKTTSFYMIMVGVGYLPQEASIFRGLSVYKNIKSVVELTEPDRSKWDDNVDSLLEELHITHIKDSPALALSGGERRRVEIARALASRPGFILLDEPFTGIDPIAIAEISELILYLKKRGLGVLITDHRVRETLDIVDRASIMFSGSVLFEGTPEQVRANPKVRELYLGNKYS